MFRYGERRDFTAQMLLEEFLFENRATLVVGRWPRFGLEQSNDVVERPDSRLLGDGGLFERLQDHPRQPKSL
jgi:hypothetical protein